MLRRTAIMSALVLLLISTLTGCGTKGIGTLSVSIDNAGVLSAASTGIKTVNVTAKNGGVTASATINYAIGETSCTFPSVLSGLWTVEANGTDATGKAIYYGKSTAVVAKGSSSTANLNLKMINGEYEMSLDLSTIDEAIVKSAEIWVYPIGEGSYTKKHILTSDLKKTHTLVATGIKPQTYEFQIRLFDAASAEYYLSSWYTFDVMPASKTIVDASLEFSSFSVSMIVEGMPARPVINTMFALVNAAGKLEVHINWSQQQVTELAKSIVYLKFYETDRFEEGFVYEPGTMLENVGIAFSMSSAQYLASQKIWTRVVCVGKNGIRGLSSPAAKYPV